MLSTSGFVDEVMFSRNETNTDTGLECEVWQIIYSDLPYLAPLNCAPGGEVCYRRLPCWDWHFFSVTPAIVTWYQINPIFLRYNGCGRLINTTFIGNVNVAVTVSSLCTTTSWYVLTFINRVFRKKNCSLKHLNFCNREHSHRVMRFSLKCSEIN